MCLRSHEPSGPWLINEHLYPFSLSSVAQDALASCDVNGNDLDPMPRYDASNENK